MCGSCQCDCHLLEEPSGKLILTASVVIDHVFIQFFWEKISCWMQSHGDVARQSLPQGRGDGLRRYHMVSYLFSCAIEGPGITGNFVPIALGRYL